MAAAAMDTVSAMNGLIALSEVSTRESRSLSMSVPETGGMASFLLPTESQAANGQRVKFGDGASSMTFASQRQARTPGMASIGSVPIHLHRARPRAMSYTEGDAFVSVQSMRPRSNTLSDEDAVGALLSFGRRDSLLEEASCQPALGQYGASPEATSHSSAEKGPVAMLAAFADAVSTKSRNPTLSRVPRERALSDMSEAALRLGKLDMMAQARRRPSSPLGQSALQKDSHKASNRGHGGGDSQSRSPDRARGSATRKINYTGQRRRHLVNIGIYSPNARRERLRRFMEKRKKRVWRKRVKYDVRKNFADSRLRFKGRFVKKEDEELMRAAMEIC